MTAGADAARDLVGSLAGAGDAADTFARGTGRRHVRAASVDDLARAAREAGARSLFVFAGERAFDGSLARGLVRASLASALDVGVWPVDPDPARASAAVARLLALHARDHAYDRALVGYSDFFTGERMARMPWCHGRDGTDAFVDRMRCGASTVVLHTHCNGVDMRLGANVLCVQADELRPAPGGPSESFLPCQAGGPCLRSRARPRAFVGAGSVRASIVVGITCSMIAPGDGLLGARFTLASALHRNDDVRAVVAPFTVVEVRLRPLALVGTWIAGGATAGSLARRLNEEASDLPTYLCVGDPAIPCARVAPEEAWDPSGGPPALATAAQAGDRVERMQVGFLRRLATSTRSDELATRTLDLARAFEAAPSAEDGALDRDYCAVLADFLAEGTYLHKYWEPAFAAGKNSVTSERHACGHAMIRHDLAARSPGGRDRFVWYCTRCAFAGDQPAGPSRVRARAIGGSIRVDLEGLGGDGEAFIAGSVEAIGEGDEVALAPRAVPLRDGAGASELPVRSVLAMPGLRTFVAVAVHRGEFAVSRLALEGDRARVSA